MNTEIIDILNNIKYNQKIKESNLISFFTPTYNRAQFLGRLYEMLLNQSSHQFVWIIVNDGSKDNTDEIAKQFINDNKLPILYIHKRNGGKHSAFKVALDKCQTQYFQCMDDDDIYSNDSVKIYMDAWNQIIKEGKKDIGAVRTIAKYKNTERFVSDNPSLIANTKTEDLSTLEMNYIRKHHQENWTCYKTEALHKVDIFPKNYWMSDVHKFFAENIWQGRFARYYKCRYIYISVRDYTDDAEVSLTRSIKSRQHYLDMFINEKMCLDEQYDYISLNYRDLIKRIIKLQLLRGYLNIPLDELINHTERKKLKFLFNLTSIISIMGNKIIKHRSKR